ncbi:MAG: hypothetical protein IJ496_02855 [Ruminococcus sp.]|nr:hypothetical protein [Ruminococcus sp.]
MFTVVICEKKLLKKLEKYHLLLAPLLKSREVVFCEWYRKADSLSAMVPELESVVGKHTEWRAILVSSEGKEKINPFDYTGYQEKRTDAIQRYGYDPGNADSLREQRFKSYRKAASNPLVRLGCALCGCPVGEQLLDAPFETEKLLTGEIGIEEVMLHRTLRDLPSRSSAVHTLQTLHRDKLLSFVQEADEQKVLFAIEEGDAHMLAQLLGYLGSERLIRLLTDSDPCYADPEYTEKIIDNTAKMQALSSFSQRFVLKNPRPSEVLCIAQRCTDTTRHQVNVRWQDSDELQYSRFSEFNLLPDMLRYMIFDLHESDCCSYEYDVLRFLTFLLITAANDIPPGLLEKNRVYVADCINNTEQFTKLFASYDKKLRNTEKAIVQMQELLHRRSEEEVDTSSLMKQAQTEVTVPVTFDLPPEELKEARLLVKKIGLAGDCPQDEKEVIYPQFERIYDRFKRMLQQPRRAVKRAVDIMRTHNRIEDISAVYLDPLQTEVLEEKAQEIEKEILFSNTIDLYQEAWYKERLQEEEGKVRGCVDTRLTRKVTVAGGAVVLGAFFAGFVPMLLSAENTVSTLGNSLLFALGGCLALAAAGMGLLLILRQDVKKVIKGFNGVSRAIADTITHSMNTYSIFLTKVCSFMRIRSVLNSFREFEKQEIVQHRIYDKHLSDIRRIRAEIHEIYRGCDLSLYEPSGEEEFYEYDYTILMDYDYFPAYKASVCTIPFMQEGCTVQIPVDFVDQITLRREELYDV